jgi:hypothetical protein
MSEFIYCTLHYNSTNFNTPVNQIFSSKRELLIQKKSLNNRGIGKASMTSLMGYMVDTNVTHIHLE